MIGRKLLRLSVAVTIVLASLPELAAATQVIFVNGIQNFTRQQALDSATEIQRVLDLSANHSTTKRDFEVLLRYNPDGFTPDSLPAGCNLPCQGVQLKQDYVELFIQKVAEEHFYTNFPNILAPFDAITTIDRSAAAAVAAYIDKLPGDNSLEPDDATSKQLAVKLAPNAVVVKGLVADIKAAGAAIVVAHSQGNLLANLAYAQVAAEMGDQARKIVRVVNVANTTRFAVSGLNITHANDGALFATASRFALETLPSQGNNWTRTTPYTQATSGCGTNSSCNLVLAPPTFKGASTSGFLDHEFVATYLSTYDLPEDPTARLSVPLTAGKTRFVDRFEDFVYAAARSLETANVPPLNPVLFDNLGDRQFVGLNYDTNGTLFSISVTGEQLGLVRNPILGNKLQGKAAIAFSMPAVGGADLKSIELPIYIQGGTNQVTLSIRRDINGLPDTSSVLATDTIIGTLKTVNAFFTDQTFTTTTINYNPGAVPLLPNTRYWIEATALDTTVAIWPYGRTSASALVAYSSGGAPYATGDPPTAIRIVVTPK